MVFVDSVVEDMESFPVYVLPIRDEIDKSVF